MTDSSLIDAERTKYERMWEFPEYRKNAPGERLVDDAIKKMAMKSGTVIDFGCGTGRAAQAFADKGFAVAAIDIAENCLDEGVDIPVFVQCLWEPIGLSGDYGFCTDVMEHIPPEKVDDVLENIACAVDRCYFQIATFKDGMGRLIGDTLHLTVKPAGWWKDRLESHFDSVDVEQRNGGVIAHCST
jgi:SAM-dependent methyltransferase